MFPLLGVAAVAAMWLRGYRLHRLRAFRKQFAAIVRAHPGPLLICSNHLTMVDSALISWAIGSYWTYLRHFRLLPWHVPERNNFSGSLGLRALCYLNKCVPIVRTGSQGGKRAVMARLEHLLRQGQVVSLFPEGKRSRSGQLDTQDFGYGVGQLATRVPDATIVCVYLRGQRQITWSKVPRRGERFYLEARPLRAQTPHRGLRAARDITQQAMGVLAEMEQRYYARFAVSSAASQIRLAERLVS